MTQQSIIQGEFEHKLTGAECNQQTHLKKKKKIDFTYQPNDHRNTEVLFKHTVHGSYSKSALLLTDDYMLSGEKRMITHTATKLHNKMTLNAFLQQARKKKTLHRPGQYRFIS